MQSRSSWLGVRERTSSQLHGLGMRLQHLGWEANALSRGQDLLFDQVLTELQWRSARKRRRYRRCWCELCFVDFDERADTHGKPE